MNCKLILSSIVIIGFLSMTIFSSQERRQQQRRGGTRTGRSRGRTPTKRQQGLVAAARARQRGKTIERGRGVESKTGNFIFFWQVPKDILSGESKLINESCFSQWYPAEFIIYNITFYNAEQFMMYCKARCFNDCESALALIETQDPEGIKKLGREVTPFDPKTWAEVAPYFVELGNIEKFRQNPALKKYLMGTGDKVLVEASPYDKVWGIGLQANDPRAMDPLQWQGKNKLGNALMFVRNKFKQEDNPYQDLFEKCGQFTGLVKYIMENKTLIIDFTKAYRKEDFFRHE